MATVACPMECDLWAECLCHMSPISSFSPSVGVFIHSVMTLIDWAPKVDTQRQTDFGDLCSFKLWISWNCRFRYWENSPLETSLKHFCSLVSATVAGIIRPIASARGRSFPSIPHKRRGLFFRATGSLTGPNQPHSSLLAAGCRTEPNNRRIRHFGPI